jgi:hypothetical protein
MAAHCCSPATRFGEDPSKLSNNTRVNVTVLTLTKIAPALALGFLYLKECPLEDEHARSSNSRPRAASGLWSGRQDPGCGALGDDHTFKPRKTVMISDDDLQNWIGRAAELYLGMNGTTNPTVHTNPQVGAVAAAMSVVAPLSITIDSVAATASIGPTSDGDAPQVCLLPDLNQDPVSSRIYVIDSVITSSNSYASNPGESTRIDALVASISDPEPSEPGSVVLTIVEGTSAGPPAPSTWGALMGTLIGVVVVPPGGSGVMGYATLPKGFQSTSAPFAGTYIEQYLDVLTDLYYLPGFDWAPVATRAIATIRGAQGGNLLLQADATYNIASPIGATLTEVNNVAIMGGGPSTVLQQVAGEFYAMAQVVISDAIMPAVGESVTVILTDADGISTSASYSVMSGDNVENVAMKLAAAIGGEFVASHLNGLVSIASTTFGMVGNLCTVQAFASKAGGGTPSLTANAAAFAASSQLIVAGSFEEGQLLVLTLTPAYGAPVVVSVTVDTATTPGAIATALVAQINASPAVMGAAAFLQYGVLVGDGSVIQLYALTPSQQGYPGFSFAVSAMTPGANSITVVPLVYFTGGGIYGDVFSCARWKGCAIKDLTIMGVGPDTYSSLSTINVTGVATPGNLVTVTVDVALDMPPVIMPTYLVEDGDTLADVAAGLASAISTAGGSYVTATAVGTLVSVAGMAHGMGVYRFSLTAENQFLDLTSLNLLILVTNGANVASTGGVLTDTMSGSVLAVPGGGTGVGSAGIALWNGCGPMKISSVAVLQTWNGITVRDFQTIELEDCTVAIWAGPFAYYCTGPIAAGNSNTFSVSRCHADGDNFNVAGIGFCCDGNIATLTYSVAGAITCNGGSFMLQNSTGGGGVNLVQISSTSSDHGGSEGVVPPAGNNFLHAAYDLRNLNLYALYGPGFGQPGTGSGGPITDVEMTNCKATATSGDAFAFANIAGVRMTQCSASNGASGFNFYPTATEIVWTGCRSLSNGGGDAGTGGVKLQYGFAGANFVGGVNGLTKEGGDGQPFGFLFNAATDDGVIGADVSNVSIVGVALLGNSTPIELNVETAVGSLTLAGTSSFPGTLTVTLTSPYGHAVVITQTIPLGESAASAAAALEAAINASTAVTGAATAFLEMVALSGTTLTLTALAAGSLGNAITTEASVSGGLSITPTALTAFSGGSGAWSSTVTIADCPGYNPQLGGPGTPPLPAAGVAVQNPLPVDALVRIGQGSGTIATVTVSYGSLPPLVIPNAGSNPFFASVPAGASITLSSVPSTASWLWSWD